MTQKQAVDAKGLEECAIDLKNVFGDRINVQVDGGQLVVKEITFDKSNKIVEKDYLLNTLDVHGLNHDQLMIVAEEYKVIL